MFGMLKFYSNEDDQIWIELDNALSTGLRIFFFKLKKDLKNRWIHSWKYSYNT